MIERKIRMKMEYESPVLEVFSFTVMDTVMDSGGDCMGFSCPDGICVVDGGCYTDGTFPNISGV